MSPIYPHDDASVPVDWGKVSAPDPFTGHLTVRKNRQVFFVSQELADDWEPDLIYNLLRPETWAHRAEWLRRDSTVRRRLERLWYRIRVWLAHRFADEFVGSDGWDA